MTADAVFIGIILLIAILGLIAIRAKSMSLKLMFAFSWILLLTFYSANRPATIAVGSSTDKTFIVIIIGIILIAGFWAFTNNIKISSSTGLENGSLNTISTEHNKWQLPEWLKSKDNYQEQLKQRRTNIEAYRARVHKALNPNERIIKRR